MSRRSRFVYLVECRLGPLPSLISRTWWLCWPRPWLVDWCSPLAGLPLVGCQVGLEVGVCWESLGSVLPILFFLWLWWSCRSCLPLVLTMRGSCSFLTVFVWSHTGSSNLFTSCCFCFFWEVVYEAPLVRSGDFLTRRFNSQYWACRSCFCFRSWV